MQAQQIAKFLLESGFTIAYFVQITEKMAIANKQTDWVDHADFCRVHDIGMYRPKNYKFGHEEDRKFFETQKFDLLLLGGWSRLIPDNILNTLKYGGLGQHGSSELLPRGRGRAPLNWGIVMGRKRLVWNIFFL